MGKIGTVVGTEDTEDGLDVVADPGGGANVSSEHFGPTGDGSKPLPGDAVALEDSSGAGRGQAVGYHDPDNESPAAPGEVFRYGRDASGNVVCSFHLKGDGTLVVTANTKVEIAAPVVHLNTPDCRLSDAAGKGVMRVGDLVAGSTPPLVAMMGMTPLPVIPSPPATVTATGGVPVVGKGISGSSRAKA
jgi:hypothetical protein